jgi:HEAT repeat protein
MSKTFKQLLNIILDESQPVPSARFSELSDLDIGCMDQLNEIWDHLTNERKRSLITELGQLAKQRFELSFEPINRLALSDSDSEVRTTAINNLWECEDPTLVPTFIAALKQDPSSEVRAAAAKALGLFIWLGEIDQLDQDLLNQTEDSLLTALENDQTQDVRRLCLESLGFSSRNEVPPLIEQAYQSGDEEQVRSAIFAMGRSANKQWQPFVLTELTNPSPIIRQEAAQSAGELELREAVESLIELLEDVDKQVNIAAIWALGQLGGEKAADALLLMLDTIEDTDFVHIIEEALDHLAFVDETRDFLLIDFDDSEEPIF